MMSDWRADVLEHLANGTDVLRITCDLHDAKSQMSSLVGWLEGCGIIEGYDVFHTTTRVRDAKTRATVTFSIESNWRAILGFRGMVM